MIKKLFAFTLLLTLSMVSIMAPASAAPKQSAKTPPSYGIDISYPQCGRRVPTDQAFGIVGVNGGNPGNQNTCLRDQLIWASKSSGAVSAQAPVQVYINTSNPGDVQSQMKLSKWPKSSSSANPYGSENCTIASESNQACSWQYGWDRGEYAVNYFNSQAPTGIEAKNIPWWLDIEEANSWQGEYQTNPDVENYDNNIAALEGWVAYLRGEGIGKVGIYSTNYMFNNIVGGRISDQSNLYKLPTWYALGPTTVSVATSACNSLSYQPLTPGSKIILTQYVSKNLDYNYSCPAAADATVWNTPTPVTTP